MKLAAGALALVFLELACVDGGAVDQRTGVSSSDVDPGFPAPPPPPPPTVPPETSPIATCPAPAPPKALYTCRSTISCTPTWKDGGCGAGSWIIAGYGSNPAEGGRIDVTENWVYD